MYAVALYAALLAMVFVALSIRTIGARRRLKIAIGDAGDSAMLRAMRVHSNFAEYVPLTLFLLFLVETSGGPRWLVHVLGSLLLIGRISHAYGVSQIKEVFAYRVSGMALTFTAILTCAAYLLYRYALLAGT